NFKVDTTEIGFEEIAKGFKENLWIEANERYNDLIKGRFGQTELKLTRELDWRPDSTFLKDKVHLTGRIDLDPNVVPEFDATWRGKIKKIKLDADFDYDMLSEIEIKPLGNVRADVLNKITIYDTEWQNRTLGLVWPFRVAVRHRVWVEASYEIAAHVDTEVTSSVRVNGGAFFKSNYDGSDWTFNGGEKPGQEATIDWSPPALQNTEADLEVIVKLTPHIHVEVAGQKFRTDLNGEARFLFTPEIVASNPAVRMDGSYGMHGDSWVDWKHTGSDKIADITVFPPKMVRYLCQLMGSSVTCNQVEE
ncbi:MAG: hypothetical protein K0V04_06550, partial [Deltaproteobacteria bacterium]|nr:hypothetical protein [Deltaproteobacteria bacterium]